MPLKFDLLEYRSELEAAGVPPIQAQVHAKALGQALAGVPCVRDLEKMHAQLRDFVTMKIDALRSELMGRIDNVRAEIQSLKYELLIHRWMFGVVVAMQGITIGMVMRVMP